MMDVIDSLFDLIFDLLCLPFFNSSIFRRGFISASVIGLTVGFIARQFLTSRSQISSYFSYLADYSELNAQGKIYKYSDK